MFNYDVNERLWNIYDCLVVLKHIIVSWDSSKDVEKSEMFQTTNQMVIFDEIFMVVFIIIYVYGIFWIVINGNQMNVIDLYQRFLVLVNVIDVSPPHGSMAVWKGTHMTLEVIVKIISPVTLPKKILGSIGNRENTWRSTIQLVFAA